MLTTAIRDAIHPKKISYTVPCIKKNSLLGHYQVYQADHKQKSKRNNSLPIKWVMIV